MLLFRQSDAVTVRADGISRRLVDVEVSPVDEFATQLPKKLLNQKEGEEGWREISNLSSACSRDQMTRLTERGCVFLRNLQSTREPISSEDLHPGTFIETAIELTTTSVGARQRRSPGSVFMIYRKN